MSDTIYKEEEEKLLVEQEVSVHSSGSAQDDETAPIVPRPPSEPASRPPSGLRSRPQSSSRHRTSSQQSQRQEAEPETTKQDTSLARQETGRSLGRPVSSASRSRPRPDSRNQASNDTLESGTESQKQGKVHTRSGSTTSNRSSVKGDSVLQKQMSGVPSHSRTASATSSMRNRPMSRSERLEKSAEERREQSQMPGVVTAMSRENIAEDEGVEENDEKDVILPLNDKFRSSSRSDLETKEEASNDDSHAMTRSFSNMSEFDNILSCGDIDMALDSAADYKAGWEKINDLQQKLEMDEVDEFKNLLDEDVDEDLMIIGTIPADELAKQEKAMEMARIEQLQREAELHRVRMNAVGKREQRAKKAVSETLRQERKKLRFREDRLVNRHFHHVKEQQEDFRKMEDRMKSILREHQGNIQEYFGDLEEADDLYGAVRGRRYKVDWTRAPRMVRIRIDMLRAIKNKLPRGRYVVMATLYDRLGGHPLRWSKLHGAKWTGSTPYPRRHQGKFYNLELSFAQKKNRIFLACPSEIDTRPSMVMVFELFLCRGRRSKVDKVVGWGAFPISNSKFELVQGKFVVPLMRGEMDDQVDKYQAMENRISNNLDSWLCNMYFDVRHLPRYVNGMKEYEVEMMFTSNLLQSQTRKDEMGMQSDSDQSADEVEEPAEALGESDEERVESDEDSEDIDTQDKALVKKNVTFGEPEEKFESDIEMSTADSKVDEANDESLPLLERGDRNAKSMPVEHTIRRSNGDSDDEEEGEGITYKRAKTGLGWILSGMKNGYSPLETKDERVDLSPRTYELPEKDTVVNVRSVTHTDLFKERPEWGEVPEALKKGKSKDNALQKAKALEGYTFSVVDVTKDVPVQSEAREKAKYLWSEVMADLRLHRWKTIEFWAMVFCLLLVFWMRLYIHCAGQWVYLQGMHVPVYEFDAKVFTCSLSYNNDNLQTLTEVGMVAMGVLSNIFVFCVLLLLSYIFQAILHTFSGTASRFLLSYGVVTLLDPFLILLFDLLYENWSGDSFKLYNYFEKTEGNGMAGIFLTVIITAVLVVFASFFLYNYILYIHMNGRMLDVYYRLHGDASTFFLPDDMEISVRTLRWIIQKSKNWRGFHGATRKISIVNYTMKDHLDPRFEERTVHLALYTQDLYGERELFRHFVRRPDGAIIEMFDSVELMGADNFHNLEKLLLESSDNIDNEENFFDDMSTHGTPRPTVYERTVSKMNPPSPQRQPSSPGSGGNSPRSSISRTMDRQITPIKLQMPTKLALTPGPRKRNMVTGEKSRLSVQTYRTMSSPRGLSMLDKPTFDAEEKYN